MEERKKQSGFTLVELLVAIFIISIISGSIIANYGPSQKKYYVSKAAQQLASDFRRVQNMALVGKTQGAINPQGYGLHIVSSSQYLLFYNADASLVYQGSGVLETINLEGGVSISPASFDVYFTPPQPTTYIQGINFGEQEFTVVSGDYSKMISVNAGGKIEIN
jgi:prepilin-type N-terminal cleavage/methylation domain-containing protein